MNNRLVSGKQIQSNLKKYKLIAITLVVWFLLSLVVSLNVLATSSYTPAAPAGSTYGFISVEYEYVVSTTNADASWMFDWDDGTTSSWLSLSEGDDSISQLHSWSATGVYNVRVKYRNDYYSDGVWSTSLQVAILETSDDDYPKIPVIPSGSTFVIAGNNYSYSTFVSEPKGELWYRFDWGDSTFSDWTHYISAETSVGVSYSWIDAGVYSVRAQAKNSFNLESEWSEPLSIEVVLDSDNDGLYDSLEQSLGSSPDDESDVSSVSVGSKSHFVVVSMSGDFIFYNTTSENSSVMSLGSDGGYLLDDDGDGSWDYVYSPASSSFSVYVVNTSFVWQTWHFIVLGCLLVVFIVWLLFKLGIIYFITYEEEIPKK